MVGLLVLSESLTSMEDATLWSALCSTHNDVMDEMGVIEDAIIRRYAPIKFICALSNPNFGGVGGNALSCDS